MVKISVIVPVYNNEKYLDRCLSSLINQSLNDIEIICVNDGSTDSSLDILHSFKEKDNRIIILSQENQGAGPSRNRGIDLAKGEYISFVDADDWLEEDAFEKLYNNSISNDSDIVLFNSREHKDNNKIRNRIYLPVDESIEYDNFVFDYKDYKRLVMNSMFVIWSKIYKTSFIVENDIRFYNHKIFNDVQFHVESMILSKRISYVPDILYNYNKQNDNSLQSDISNSNKRLLIFDVFDGVKEFLDKQGIFDEFNVNFTRFKINESKVNFEKVSADFKEDYYKRMREEFIKMDVTSDILKQIPQRLYSFYIVVLNCQTYENFDLYNIEVNKARANFIDKKVISKEMESFKGLGINPIRDENSIIVSLTSFPDRMEDIRFCLYSLLNQNLKPHKVILWLAYDQFPNKEKDLPKDVLDFRENGLTIEWCKDIKSYKKIIPVLKKYPDYYIATADDDVFYQENWLKNLWDMHEKYPNTVIGTRAKRIILKDDKIADYNEWELVTKTGEPSFLYLITGAGGVLYFPNAFTELVFDEDLFLKLAPFGDDIWLWAMLVLNNVKIKPIKYPIYFLKYVNIAREVGVLNKYRLWDENKKGFNNVQVNNIINQFPQILEILLNEK